MTWAANLTTCSQDGCREATQGFVQWLKLRMKETHLLDGAILLRVPQQPQAGLSWSIGDMQAGAGGGFRL